MALSVGTFSTATFSGASTKDIVLGAAVATDDIVLLFVHDEVSSGGIQTVSTITDTGGGFAWHQLTNVQVANGHHDNLEVWWAHATGAVGAGGLTVHVTMTGTIDDASLAVGTVTGADTSSPLDTSGAFSSTNITGTVNTVAKSGVSTTAANSVLMAFFGSSASAKPSAPTGWTQTFDTANGGGANFSESRNFHIIESAAQSNITVTTTGSQCSQYGFLVFGVQEKVLGVTGTMTPTEATDVFNGFGGLISGTMNVTEAKDTFRGAGIVPAAAPSFVNAGTQDNTGFGTSVTPTLPGSRVNGNLLIAWVQTGTGDHTFTFPVGWTVIDHHDTDKSAAYAYRYVDGTEASPAITWSGNTSGEGQVVQFTGVKTSSPIGATSKTVGAANPITGGSLTTTSPEYSLAVALIVAFTGFETIGTPSGYTAESSSGGSGGTYNISGVSEFNGATSPAISESASSSGAFVTFMFELLAPPLPPSGAWASTDTKDTFAAAGNPQLKGTMAATEAKDVFAGRGPVKGPLAATETADAMAFTGTVSRPLGVDAHATGHAQTAATSATVAITTTAPDDVIVLAVLTGGFFNHGEVTSVTDTTGLTWTKRHTRRQFGVAPTTEIWWAHKATPGATTITVNTAATGFLCLDALAISGARTDKPWDHHTGAGIYNDNFGSGNPTGVIYSSTTKCMGLAFYTSNDVASLGTVTAGWTYQDSVSAAEVSGQTGRLESAWQVFSGKQNGQTTIAFGQNGGASNDRCIMQDVIVAANDPSVNTSTADAIRWFFDGHGNQQILSMSGTANSATQTLTTYNPDTVVLVAAMISSSRGTHVDHISDSGNHSGWTRRSIVQSGPNISLETWWVQMADAFSGNITVTLDSNTQPGDLLGFIIVGINGPDLFQRGEIFDGHPSLPHTESASAASYQTDGPFSTLNENVLEISIAANTSTNPTGFQQDPWLQFIGNFFGSTSGELVSQSPPFNIALQAKFSETVVSNDTAELDVSPQPPQWLMIADALPVGPVSPPSGIWASVEAKDTFTHVGDFTAIGVASPGGWIGFPPNHVTMTAVEPKDKTTNSGAFTAIWNTNGWIGYVPLRFSMGLVEAKDVPLLHGWVLGPTTILARMDVTEDKDRFAASNIATVTAVMASIEAKDRFSGNALVIPTATPIPPRQRRVLIVT